VDLGQAELMQDFPSLAWLRRNEIEIRSRGPGWCDAACLLLAYALPEMSQKFM